MSFRISRRSRRSSISIGMGGGISTSMEIYSTTLRTHDHHREKHRQLETILALSWANEGESSAVLGHVGSSRGVLESSWGSPRPSWDNLRGIARRLGIVSGLTETVLEQSWRHLDPLGGVLESSWGVLGSPWGVLGLSWERLGASWGCLGGVLEASWTSWRRLGSVLEAT